MPTHKDSKRVHDVVKYATIHGDRKTIKEFGVNQESLNRYKRAYRESLKPENVKILILDIENAPVQAYVWNKQVWNARVMPAQIEEDWFMLTWSAKWLYDSDIYNDKLSSKEAKLRDDSRLVKSLWKLFNEADIIIAHNAIGFDIPMCNTRFIMNGLLPPTPYRIIDTLKIARREFCFTHNKLDYLGQLLELGGKIETEFQLWVDCMKGDTKALTEMSRYNDQDVLLLEEVYLKLRPWIKSHPNINVYEGTTNRCASCGSSELKEKGQYTTNVSSYTTYQCECGAFTRAGLRESTTFRSIAR